jgi:plastocyanin
LALALLLAAAVVACGEKREGRVTVQGGLTDTTGTGTTPNPESGTAPSSAAPTARVDVVESDYQLEPANPRIRRAGVVRFVARNEGKVGHALEVEGPAGEAKTGRIRPGGRADLEVDLSKPGTYEWYCPIDDHKRLGMKGAVTVAGGGSGSGGASTTETGGRYRGY